MGGGAKKLWQKEQMGKKELSEGGDGMEERLIGEIRMEGLDDWMSWRGSGSERGWIGEKRLAWVGRAAGCGGGVGGWENAMEDGLA